MHRGPNLNCHLEAIVSNGGEKKHADILLEHVCLLLCGLLQVKAGRSWRLCTGVKGLNSPQCFLAPIQIDVKAFLSLQSTFQSVQAPKMTYSASGGEKAQYLG